MKIQQKIYKLLRYLFPPVIILVSLLLIVLFVWIMVTFFPNSKWVSPLFLILILTVIFSLTSRMIRVSDILTKIYLLNDDDELFQINLNVHNTFRYGIFSYYMDIRETANAIELMTSRVVGNTLVISGDSLGLVIRVEEVISARKHKGGMYYVCVNHTPKAIASIIGAVICFGITCILYQIARDDATIQLIYFLFIFLDIIAIFFVLLFITKINRGEP
ncbi:MAG TPA: hypothetical protein PLZ77_01785 [Lachnospiraceae bacterium]|nr:hypothetical protein [Lachnospiraceae bacterium]